MLSLIRRRVFYKDWDYSKDYLTFTAIESGTFSFTEHGSGDSLQYSLDDGATWTTLASDVASPTVSAGNRIIWKGTRTPGTGTPSGNIGIGEFSATSKFKASGNIMSLLFSDNFEGQVRLNTYSYAFYRLFYENTKLISAENLILPATYLSSFCYSQMFIRCTNLIEAPLHLPATVLQQNCYFRMFAQTQIAKTPIIHATTLATQCCRYMFIGCTSLTAVELPSAGLVSECYTYMFNGCTSLNYIKCLATDISATNCTTNWLGSVSATGTFVKADSMTGWQSGVSGIPSGWTVEEVAGPDV